MLPIGLWPGISRKPKALINNYRDKRRIATFAT